MSGKVKPGPKDKHYVNRQYTVTFTICFRPLIEIKMVPIDAQNAVEAINIAIMDSRVKRWCDDGNILEAKATCSDDIDDDTHSSFDDDI